MTIIAFVAVYLLNPFFSKFLMDHTSIDEMIFKKNVERVDKFVEENVFPETTDSIKREEALANINRANQIKLIEELPVPEAIKKKLQDNNNDDIYELLGVKTVFEYIAKYMTIMIVNLISSVILFALIRIALLLISILLVNAAKALPMVASIDRIGGFVMGALVGVIIAWAVYTVLGFIMTDAVEQLTKESEFLQFLNERNFIREIFLSMGSVFGR